MQHFVRSSTVLAKFKLGFVAVIMFCIVQYNAVFQGKATGNKHGLWLRWQLQQRLFAVGCFIQLHAGKVLFLGLLLLSLCCVGLKIASLETRVENLWVEGMYQHVVVFRRSVSNIVERL
jgi:hypothetical protein